MIRGIRPHSSGTLRHSGGQHRSAQRGLLLCCGFGSLWFRNRRPSAVLHSPQSAPALHCDENCFRCSWQQESSLCFTGRPSTPDCNNDPSGLGLGDNRTGTTRIATVARGVPQSSKIVGFAVENAEVRRAQVQTPSARFRENEVHQQSPSSPNFCSGFKRLITMQETLTKSFSITFLSLAA